MFDRSRGHPNCPFWAHFWSPNSSQKKDKIHAAICWCIFEICVMLLFSVTTFAYKKASKIEIPKRENEKRSNDVIANPPFPSGKHHFTTWKKTHVTIPDPCFLVAQTPWRLFEIAQKFKTNGDYLTRLWATGPANWIFYMLFNRSAHSAGQLRCLCLQSWCVVWLLYRILSI